MVFSFSERTRDHLHTLQTHTVIGGIVSPSNDPKSELADSTMRCKLLELALKTSNWIRLSTWEIEQSTTKNTREVLQHHQNVLNSFLCNNLDNNVNNEDIKWLPEGLRNNSLQLPIQIKLLCSIDFLESLGTPGLWSEEDVSP